jgi:signal transduction histidine kinase
MFRNYKLSTKLLLSFVPLFLIAIVTSYVLNTREEESAMLGQAKTAVFQRAHIVRESLVSQMVDKYKVDDSYLERLQLVGGLQDLFIWINVDNLHLTEDLIDSSRVARLTKRMQLALSKGDEGLPVFKTGNALYIERENTMEAIVPFKAEKKCLACHSVPVGHVLGVAHISVPLVDIRAAIESNAQRSAVITAGFAAVILLIGYVLFRTLVQRPVKDLVDATVALGQGNLEYEMRLLPSNDELGTLAQSFEKMRTALKQSQEALRSSTVGQIATSLIRDFRTPMRQIVSSVNQIEKGSPTNEQKAQLCESARASVESMNKMAQDLLDFTTGDLKLNKMPCNVSSVMNYVADALKSDLLRDSIRLDVQNGYQGVAPLDYERVSRALINIIGYSSNYVPPQGIIRLSTTSQGNSLIIKIADNGSAIPPQYKDRIFEPFVKIVQEKGVGLSLALAKRIIDMQGGSIEVESVEGKGNTFVLVLPLNS